MRWKVHDLKKNETDEKYTKNGRADPVKKPSRASDGSLP